MYEYAVGKIINTLFNNYFPCFVETYGVYKYNTDEEWSTSQDSTNVKKLQDILTEYPTIDYKDSCINSKHLCILIQHIKDAPSLHDRLADTNPRNYLKFREKELLYCLYQIYYSLSMLSDYYTHYDLHTLNVLLYQPVNGTYIHHHYYLQDDTGTANVVVSFKSRYIVKIIDYGRSYINDYSRTNINTSLAYYDKICSIKECDPDCGSEVGYQWLSPEYDTYSINSSLSNKSHDLKLLHGLKKYFDHEQYMNSSAIKLRKIIDKTVYTGTNGLGTQPNLNPGYPDKINNVMDAERLLRDMILEPDEIANNNVYHNASFRKLGDLHVYGLSRRMKYVPA
jgi:hypothetical protein